MGPELTGSQQADFLSRGFSRRQFGRIAALLGAGATLPFYNEACAGTGFSSQRDARRRRAGGPNANENPLLGLRPRRSRPWRPCSRRGADTITSSPTSFARRWPQLKGSRPSACCHLPGRAPLTQTILAFTSPTRGLVTADPGYEPGERTRSSSAKVFLRVPLAKDYGHDVRAMVAADLNAGLFYVCNPNNPTGTLTSDADIDWLVDHLPEGAVLLLDEAYTHITECCCGLDLVRKEKNVVILRTFSKIYGMAWGCEPWRARPARPAGANHALQFRRTADYRCCSGNRQPQVAQPDPAPAKDHRRHPAPACFDFLTSTVLRTSPLCRTSSCSM